MLMASPGSCLAGAAGAGPLGALVLTLLFSFIATPALSRSRFEEAPPGRAARALPPGAARTAPCTDRPVAPRSPLQEVRRAGARREGCRPGPGKHRDHRRRRQ